MFESYEQQTHAEHDKVGMLSQANQATIQHAIGAGEWREGGSTRSARKLSYHDTNTIHFSVGINSQCKHPIHEKKKKFRSR